MRKFPHYRQLDSMDCGAFVLRMIAKYYGKDYSAEYLREQCGLTKGGVSLWGICKAANSLGFKTYAAQLSFEQLRTSNMLPCVLHWNSNHFVVCYRIKKQKQEHLIYISDPATQRLCYTEVEFMKNWTTYHHDEDSTGVALFLKPTEEFFKKKSQYDSSSTSLRQYVSYFTPHKKRIAALLAIIGFSSLIQFIMPFLSQAIVDKAISVANLTILILICLGQFFLSATQLIFSYLQNRLLLEINTKIDISMISEFLQKIMQMPLKFFDSKHTGDIMQRIEDQARIKSFIMDNSMNILLSCIHLIFFLSILAFYHIGLFAIFLLGNILYITWTLNFMKYRRALDIKSFSQASNNNSMIIQIVEGVRDIKLYNCEKKKRREWENIQRALFQINLKRLKIDQLQESGSLFFSQTTNILLIFIAAKNVISGNMTLGMMMSISYITGQLSSITSSFISFAHSLQDARISLERMSEVIENEGEDSHIGKKKDFISGDGSITVKGLSFSYGGKNDYYALKDINLHIPRNTITAVVGESGCGKTTLLKMLQGWYIPNKGDIFVGDTNLLDMDIHFWRSQIGCVMQDNYIFSDTIANNIAMDDKFIDRNKMCKAAVLANANKFINTKPKSYDSHIGMEGAGLSQGQKQRLLIARAIYKAPKYIFFDEATNALDSRNECDIMKKMQNYYQGRTVIIAAHRLSTIINADQIVVLKDGMIVEIGQHAELLSQKGHYYELVKKQINNINTDWQFFKKE